MTHAVGQALQAPLDTGPLAHEYTDIDWDIVYRAFDRLPELRRFGRDVSRWLRDHTSS